MSRSTGQIIHEVLQALGATSEEELQVAKDIANINRRLANTILLQKLPKQTQLGLLKLVMEGNQDAAFEKMKTLFDETAVKQAQKEASERILHDYFESVFSSLNEDQKQAVGQVLEKYRELIKPYYG